ncbi:hypothetical protein [uncultured Porphyromonas sp.]|uniref:hypothetical protein n=1 Tax=uncultured Porphyromonas sp. TaxID=159274 RepID=UPI0025DDE660|nr:hypothetical protein [uncultured Porphyromonas sp.]
MKKEKRTRQLYTEEEKRVHIKQYKMSGLTAYGYSKITGVNRATLRSWINKCSEKDLDMVSCSFNHEDETFMKKGKNPKATSDLSANIYASAGASAGASASASAGASAPEGSPGDLSSPLNEFNVVRETVSVSERERRLEEKIKLLEEEVKLVREENKLVREENKLMEERTIGMEVELEKSREQAHKAKLRAFALDTLIQVADETYGFDLKKNFGSKR